MLLVCGETGPRKHKVVFDVRAVVVVVLPRFNISVCLIFFFFSLCINLLINFKYSFKSYPGNVITAKENVGFSYLLNLSMEVMRESSTKVLYR